MRRFGAKERWKHMKIEVRVPTILRVYTGDAKVVTAAGETVREVLINLDENYPGISGRLMDGSELRRFINIYRNDDDVRFLAGLDTALAEGDTLTILPAVAGG